MHFSDAETQAPFPGPTSSGTPTWKWD